MISGRLRQVLEEIRLLSPDEQKQLRGMLDAMFTQGQPQMTEEKFERLLLDRGVISNIPPPITDYEPYRDRSLIEVKGKPLSETILEERQ